MRENPDLVHNDICNACGQALAAPEAEERRGAPLMFPEPGELSDNLPLTFRTREEIVKLYKQAHPETRGRRLNFADYMKVWLVNEALSVGWAAVYWPLDYPSKTLSAGAVFMKFPVELPRDFPQFPQPQFPQPQFQQARPALLEASPPSAIPASKRSTRP